MCMQTILPDYLTGSEYMSTTYPEEVLEAEAALPQVQPRHVGPARRVVEEAEGLIQAELQLQQLLCQRQKEGRTHAEAGGEEEDNECENVGRVDGA